MADGANSHNNEVCAFCIRFIDENNNAREKFTDFIPLLKITGYRFKTNLGKDRIRHS